MTRYDDLATHITSHLIKRIKAADLANSTGPLWTGGALTHFAPLNATTGDYYKGINVLALYIAGTDNGYSTAQWATYNQWNKIGAQVRKGESGTRIVKWVPIKSKDDDQPQDPNEAPQKRRLVPKVYTVHNADQVDGYDTPADTTDPVDTLANVETFIANTEATINRGGGRAFYRISTDEIHLPDADRFTSTEAHYAVWLHELTHWTGATHRLNRELGHAKDSAEYAREELVAELGAAMLCARLHITPEPRDDHATYLKFWLKDLTDDTKTIAAAAAQAQHALEYLQNLQPEPTGATPELATV